jgi:hypothetical protein
MISSPDEGGSCSSEIKYDRRTALGSKLFVWGRRSQKKAATKKKLYWIPTPVKMCSEINFSYDSQNSLE